MCYFTYASDYMQLLVSASSAPCFKKVNIWLYNIYNSFTKLYSIICVMIHNQKWIVGVYRVFSNEQCWGVTGYM